MLRLMSSTYIWLILTCTKWIKRAVVMFTEPYFWVMHRRESKNYTFRLERQFARVTPLPLSITLPLPMTPFLSFEYLNNDRTMYEICFFSVSSVDSRIRTHCENTTHTHILTVCIWKCSPFVYSYIHNSYKQILYGITQFGCSFFFFLI